MAYRIQHAEAVEDAVRRIAREQVTAALARAVEPGEDIDDAVHAMRTNCKKLRGLIRLVQPHLKTFEQENATFRDAARLLARSRDAAVRLATFEKHAGKNTALRTIHEMLRDEYATETSSHVDSQSAMLAAAEMLRSALERLDQWNLRKRKFKLIRSGLKQTYADARNAMQTATQNPSVENLHEWRKYAKYHWYHARLLRDIYPKQMNVRRKTARELTDLLGDDHDMAMLILHLRAHAQHEAVRNLLDQLDLARSQGQRDAIVLGKKLFKTKPTRFTEEVKKHWKTWRKSRGD